jgi:hypothetical protein
MKNTREVLERVGERFALPEPMFERLQRRRDRKRRNQRIMAGVVGIGVFAAAIWGIATGGPFDRTQTPATRGPTVPPAPDVPDYVIDLNTGVMTPLPETIIRTAIRTAGETGEGREAQSMYAASPDGSMLAYVGTSDGGPPQIFIAGIDGTGVRQVTHGLPAPWWPAWSPDGTLVAYARSTGLFVLDVATGESTQVTDESGFTEDQGLQFTPDGASLLYTAATPTVDCTSIGGCGELRTVPIAGGPSRLLIGPEGDHWGDLGGVVNGSLSPDGSLVTFNAPAIVMDVQRWVANADGTGRRLLPGCYYSIPAGTWSPDGSRIVCMEDAPPTYDRVLVIDVATGEARGVARGRAAIWLDDHTLLVER